MTTNWVEPGMGNDEGLKENDEPAGIEPEIPIERLPLKLLAATDTV